MRVCLISPLLQHIYLHGDISAKYPPLGLGYIASVLRASGHEVKIIERKLFVNYGFDREKYLAEADQKTIKELSFFRPDIVGITSTTPAVMDAFHVARLAKAQDKAPLTVIGGAHPSILPEQTLKQCDDLDVACRGEGEFVMLDIASGTDYKNIKGITYRNGNGFISTGKRELLEELDKIPFPARDLFDPVFYFSEDDAVMRGTIMRGTTIFTARGCPFRCAFCLSTHLAQVSEGRYARFHSPEYIAGEIECLIDKYGINGINILDDMFAINKNRAMSICETFIKRGLHKKIKYNVNLRVDSADRDLLEILKESGCINVVYGCESGSAHSLKIMNKNTTVAKNIEAIKITKKVGITCDVNILIGLPGEKAEDIRETINFLKKTRPDKIRLAKLYPIPGTAIFNDLADAGTIRSEYEDWNEIGERYDLNEVTFADMPYKKFLYLWNKLGREVVLPTNYMFGIRANSGRDPGYVIKNFLLMILHLSFLYLPLGAQRYLKMLSQKMSHKIRYIFR